MVANTACSTEGINPSKAILPFRMRNDMQLRLRRPGRMCSLGQNKPLRFGVLLHYEHSHPSLHHLRNVRGSPPARGPLSSSAPLKWAEWVACFDQSPDGGKLRVRKASRSPLNRPQPALEASVLGEGPHVQRLAEGQCPPPGMTHRPALDPLAPDDSTPRVTPGETQRRTANSVPSKNCWTLK